MLAKSLIVIDGRPLMPFKATNHADPMQVRVRRTAWWAIRVCVEVSLKVVAPRAPGRGRGNRARHRNYPSSQLSALSSQRPWAISSFSADHVSGRRTRLNGFHVGTD